MRYDRAVHVPPSPQTRAWLRIDGITNDVALWFNDKYLGELVTSFRAHYLELPQSVESATLSIEFLNRHRIAMPSVEIVRTGPIRITRHKVICTEATSERGGFDIHAEFDAQSTTDAWISCEIRGSDSEVVVSALRHHSLARGRNRLKWTEVLDQPLIWKPRGLSRGQTPLYTIHTSIGVEDEKSPSDFAEMFPRFAQSHPVDEQFTSTTNQFRLGSPQSTLHRGLTVMCVASFNSPQSTKRLFTTKLTSPDDLSFNNSHLT